MKRSKLSGVFLVIAAVVVIYLMFVMFHFSVSRPATVFRPPMFHRNTTSTTVDRWNYSYEVMFDAGSTGTRVHVFQFHLDNHKDVPTLVHETFRAIKPGLSAYADHPHQCSSGILELLEVVKSSIPSPWWSSTPVVLKATAGLRLLPGQKSQQLLDTVRALFKESPFMSTEDSVSIMDGTDEGISAWITVSFLTGSLTGAGSPTVGMLDLGGGSTQITFRPQDERTIQTSPTDDIHSFRMFNTTHTVYTHSYLGLGLMAARLSILGMVDSPPRGSSELVSPCLTSESSGSWEYADATYTVKGQKAGEPVYETCVSHVEKVLSRKKVVKVSEVGKVPFYAFSYYYDRAMDLGLIGGTDGGTVKVSDYKDGAKRVCSSPAPTQSLFLCLDLIYISVLLQDLGFPSDKEIKVARTINQVETSWALGATFTYLQTLKRT
ncbi:ectonucleoside triphosphate diphosphohydrolase 6 isoform 1-T2 [Pholidichthys leucotaenia]